MNTKTKLNKSVFIGLGGFGADAIVRLKSTLLDNFGEIPTMIKLLAIDTDLISRISYKNKVGNTISLDEDEFIQLKIPDFHKFAQIHPKETSFYHKELLIRKSSLPEIYPIHFRSCGRFSLIANYNSALRQRLINTIKSVEDGSFNLMDKYDVDVNNPIEIFVVFSLAGKAGSGLFIDLPLFLKGTGIVSQNTQINAIGLLPDVYASLGAAAANCTPNAIAAMTEYELIADDMLQEFIPDPSHPARLVKTPAGSYPVDPANLYDNFYLINNLCSNGVKYETANEIADIVSKSFFLEICEQEEEDEREKLLKEKEKHFEKINQRIKDKTLRYSGIGYAEMIFDPKQVAAYYSLLQVNSICNNLLKPPAEKKNIADEVQICFDEWRIQEDQMRDDVINFLAHNKPKQRFTGVSKFDESSATAIKLIRENYIKSLKDSLNKFIFNSRGTLDQITGRALNNLQSFASAKINAQEGLYYLKDFLPNMIGRFKGMIYEMTLEQKEFEARLHAMEDKYLTLLEGIDNAISISRLNVFKNRRKAIEYACNEYSNLVNEEATCIHEIERRTAAMAFYRKMIERAEIILNSIIGFEDRLKQVVENTSIQIQKIKSRNPKEPFTVNVTPEYIRSITMSSNDNNAEMDVFFKSNLISDYTFGQHSDASELFNAIKDYTNKLSNTRTHIETTLFDLLEKMPHERVRDLFQKMKSKLGVLRRLNTNYPLDTWQSYDIGIYGTQYEAPADQRIIIDNKKDGDSKIEMDFDLPFSGELEGYDNKTNKYRPTIMDVLKSEFKVGGRLPELSITNDPGKIIFVRRESKAPAFLIKNFEKYAFDLKHKKGIIQEYLFYSNKYWGDLIKQKRYSLFPLDKDAILKAWTLAFFVTKVEKETKGSAAFEFISKTKRGKYSAYDRENDKMVDLQAYRHKAYDMFFEMRIDETLVPLLQQAIRENIDTYRAKLEDLKNDHKGNIYVNEYSSHKLGKTTYNSEAHENTRKLVMEEFRFLQNTVDISDLTS